MTAGELQQHFARLEAQGLDVESLLVDLSLDTDRLEDVSELPIEPRSQLPAETFPPASCGSFPTPSCPIAASAPSWATLTAAIAATDLAVLAEIGSSSICKKIEITPIEQDEGFTLDTFDPAWCVVEAIGADFVCFLGAEGALAASGPLLTGGIGGGPPFPLGSGSLCEGLEQASLVAENSEQVLEAMLDCWEGSYIQSMYAGTDIIRCQIEEIASLLPAIERAQFEESLIRKGGSRPAVFYLEEDESGELERLRGYAQTAITETKAIGYSVSGKVENFMGYGDQARAAGKVKEAFDWYRKAYQEVTVGSSEFVGP